MPRAIWTGTIAFGLVSVPVRMTSAVSEHTLHFHFVHEPDGSPIGYEKVCKKEDKPSRTTRSSRPSRSRKASGST
jgi:DNA end-binding protein Ku